MRSLALGFVAFATILFVSAVQATPVQGPNGNYYERIDLGDAAMLWSEANADAQTRSYQGIDGHLATILDAQTQSFLYQNLRIGAPGDCWFGATDSAVEGEWRWVTGELFWLGDSQGSAQNGLYENWSSGEPNNSGEEDGAEMWSNGFWNDEKNASRRTCYFIEFSEMPTPVPVKPVPVSPAALLIIAVLLGAMGTWWLSARIRN